MVSHCAGAMDDGVLMDYWLGALTGAEEEAAELHLLGCDACGGRLRAEQRRWSRRHKNK